MTFPAIQYQDFDTKVAQEVHRKGLTAYDIAKRTTLAPSRAMNIIRGFSEPKLSEAKLFEILLDKPALELFDSWIKKREARLK